MPSTIVSYLGLGSNMGNPHKNLKAAIQFISEIKAIQVLHSASLYYTKAWGNTNQPDFANTVIEIGTHLTADELLKALQGIENNMGRVREKKWGPRVIDIDIILYGNYVVNQPHLIIPHPHLIQRSFVLAPLFELNNEISIPKLGELKKYINSELFKMDIIDMKPL